MRLSDSLFRNSLLVALSLLLTFAGCRESVPAEIKSSHWQFSFELAPDTIARVQATLQGGDWYLENGGEVIVLTETSDSTWSTPVFDGEVALKKNKSGTLVGYWEDLMRTDQYRVPLVVAPVHVDQTQEAADHSRWAVTFGRGEGAYGGTLLINEGDAGQPLLATIMTPTGDYRFLHGDRTKKEDSNGEVRELWTLQTFDGAHLFWLQAELKDGKLKQGVFKSGTHYTVNWEAARLPNTNLAPHSTRPDMNAAPINIQGINAQGKSVSWSQANAPADVTILEVTGTWCPNCMDAGRSLAKIQRGRPDLDIISLCFERLGDPSQALGRIARFKSNIGATWPHWWAGPASKGAAADSLGFLDQVLSFPTTIFVPRNGTPVVHSGFSGPATGVYYEEQQARFEAILDSLSGR